MNKDSNFIISIVGKSGSGKTTLIEKLLPALRQRGLRIATIKHDAHDFEIDHEGKDSWRHRQAGADAVLISSPQKIALVRAIDQEWSLRQLAASFLSHVDLVIAEGYRLSDAPKIEVSRQARSTELLCGPNDDLVAIASDHICDSQLAPCFSLEDAHGLAECIIKRMQGKAIENGRVP